jgi:DNA-directed RNA polymerase specialized sigma24 family protein
MQMPAENSSQSRPEFQVLPAASAAIAAARAAVAERLLANEPTLLAFIRKSLGTSAASERSADDVFATTLRRSDALVASNALLAGLPDSALLALASTISRHAILESSRQAARTARIRKAAASRMRDRGEAAAALPAEASRELNEVMRSVIPESDLAVLVLRMHGLGWSAIAATLGTTPAGAHRRYYRALKVLSEAVQDSPGLDSGS